MAEERTDRQTHTQRNAEIGWVGFDLIEGIYFTALKLNELIMYSTRRSY